MFSTATMRKSVKSTDHQHTQIEISKIDERIASALNSKSDNLDRFDNNELVNATETIGTFIRIARAIREERKEAYINLLRHKLIKKAKDSITFNLLFDTNVQSRNLLLLFDESLLKKLDEITHIDFDFLFIWPHLPDQIKLKYYSTVESKLNTFVINVSSFLLIYAVLDSESKNKYFKLMENKILEMTSTEDIFIDFIRKIDKNSRAAFAEKLKKIRPSIVSNAIHYFEMQKKIAEGGLVDVVKEKFPEKTTNVFLFVNIIKLLSINNQYIYADALMEKLLELTHTSEDFKAINEVLPYDKKIIYLAKIQPRLLDLTKNPKDFMTIRETLTKEYQINYIKEAKKLLPDFVTDLNSLIITMICFEEDDGRNDFLENFADEQLLTFTKYVHQFFYIFAILPEMRKQEFADKINQDQIIGFKEHANNFVSFYKILPNSARQKDYFEKIDRQINALTGFIADIEMTLFTGFDFNSYSKPSEKLDKAFNATINGYTFRYISDILPADLKQAYQNNMTNEKLLELTTSPQDFIHISAAIPDDRKEDYQSKYRALKKLALTPAPLKLFDQVTRAEEDTAAASVPRPKSR
jgi:hypothetical protein